MYICIYTYVFVCVKIYSHICLLNSALVLYRPIGLNSVYLKLKSHRYILFVCVLRPIDSEVI